ncbi:predicted protein [Histoplasma capsulatum H143]|uniref:Uncharacterized protein n=1 Tax=Ajellomyces capsulatus (strain H143) TaxID=544712 RepID=C6HGY2_AJECH|nr:predicted protein [Histoplasma capsulatum H143]
MESPYFDIDCIMLSATPHIPRTRDFTGPPDADFSMVKSEDGRTLIQMPDHMFYGQCSETASRDRDKPYPAYNSIPVSSRTGEINPLARKYLNETETLLPYKKSTCNYSITRKPYYHDALHKCWAPILDRPLPSAMVSGLNKMPPGTLIRIAAMLLAAITSSVLASFAHMPDALGYASAMTRDSAYFLHAAAGSMLDGLMRSRKLKDKKTIIGISKASESYGSMAHCMELKRNFGKSGSLPA